MHDGRNGFVEHLFFGVWHSSRQRCQENEGTREREGEREIGFWERERENMLGWLLALRSTENGSEAKRSITEGGRVKIDKRGWNR